MGPLSSTETKSAITTPSSARLLLSAARYLAGKALTILIIIFVGVFLTMLIVSYPTGGGDEPGKSPFELRLETQIDQIVRSSMYAGTIPLDSNGQPDRQCTILLTNQVEVAYEIAPSPTSCSDCPSVK